MDAITRKTKLDELKGNQLNIAMTGIPLRYKGTTRTEIVYRIPLDYLVYNKYNGRIGSDVLSYEKQNGVLNAELNDDKAIIEKFLYESKVDRNKTTMDSLLKNGQQRYGIVTSDGTIVDEVEGTLSPDTVVSMNFWGFMPSFLSGGFSVLGGAFGSFAASGFFSGAGCLLRVAFSSGIVFLL